MLENKLSCPIGLKWCNQSQIARNQAESAVLVVGAGLSRSQATEEAVSRAQVAGKAPVASATSALLASSSMLTLP